MPNKPSIKTLLKTRLLAENQKEKLLTTLKVLKNNDKLETFEKSLFTALQRERTMKQFKK